MDALWQIELLGGLRATRGDQVIQRFRSQKVGALLAYMAYYGHRPHPRDLLIELLWPDCEPEVGRNRLSVTLSSLRRQLEPPGISPGAVIVSDHATVHLNPAAITTDVAAFEAALRAANRADGVWEQVERLTEAVGLYRSELLPGFFEEWVLPERQRLAEASLRALGRGIALLEQAQDLPRALELARRAVAADPLREESHSNLIRLLAANGQRAAALRQYQELEQLLAQELDDTPAPELRALVRELERRAPAGRQSPSQTTGREGATPAHPPPHGMESGPHRAATPAPNSFPSPLPSGTVTFLLTDIEGSTALWERTGEAFPAALATHHALLRDQFRQHGGVEVKEIGDAFLVAFPRAGDALACGVAAQRALAAHRWSESVSPLRVRMALHTGDITPEAGDYHGLVLHHAQRILTAGHGGQILCSEATATLLRRDLAPGARLVELGIYRLRDVPTPERLFQVNDPERAQREFPPLKAEAGHAAHLPLSFTRFFGREEELSLLGKLLLSPEPRLVTLMGAGGSGKTRLALEVGRQLLPAWEGAVWFVPLADLTEARQLGQAVRDAMRLPRSPGEEPWEQVVQALSRQPALLILDNFEHLVSEGALLVERLLERVPTLTCLVTSRQRLNLDGEREFLIPPLATPNDGLAPEGLIRWESVQLFVDRAQAARPDFHLTAANAAAVTGLCRKLEGIPLAIELAAARVGVLTPVQMLPRLEQRFELLARPGRDGQRRHESLRAALDWSYRLLSPALQSFFARLSVLRDGWSLEAAEAVCEEPLVLDYLAELRECSLVQVEESGEEMRYRLLETLREYGAEQLAPEEQVALVRRHAAYFLARVEQAEPELRGSAQGEWLDRLEQDHENIRSALQALVTRGENEQAVRMGNALWRFWWVRGYLTEGRERLAQLLALTEAREATATRAKLLNGAGILAWQQGDYPAAERLYEESLTIRRRLGDKQGIASSLNNLGLITHELGDYARARALYQESMGLLQELGNRYGVATSLNNLGMVAERQGDLEAAGALYQESLRLRREIEDRSGVADSLNNMGNVAKDQGDYSTARSLYEESLAIKKELGNKGGISHGLYNLGDVALCQGDERAAEALYDESLALARELKDAWGIAAALNSLGDVARRHGEYDRARGLHTESLVIQRALGDKSGMAGNLEGLGGVARAQEQPARGAQLLGAAEAVREAIGAPLAGQARREWEQEVAEVRAALGEAALAAAWAAGRAMSLEDAVALALEEPGPGCA
jgi:predicted ATPase/DNA-binding SARP family transcriptional activator/class 3 adenylate cyclase